MDSIQSERRGIPRRCDGSYCSSVCDGSGPGAVGIQDNENDSLLGRRLRVEAASSETNASSGRSEVLR
ncbi:hypothetical protein BDP67DRAFT_499182 [Colletotrichum lupini]|nr:hypothetical protein BDP67DRAFT_499182 [Colletotrichum lupini]